MRTNGQSFAAARLEDLVPDELCDLENPQTAIPRIAKDGRLIREIEDAVRRAPTCHDLRRGDARDLSSVPNDGTHLAIRRHASMLTTC